MLTRTALPVPAGSGAGREPISKLVWWLVGLDLLLPLLAAQFFAPDIEVKVGLFDAVAAAPAFVLLWAVGALVIATGMRRRSEISLYSKAFLLRSFVALLLASSFQFDDERALHVSAVGRQGGGYVRMVRLLYAVFGDNILVAKALNVMLGSLVVVLVGQLVADPRLARRAQLLALATPPLVIYSAVNLKEASTALLTLVCVLAGVRLVSGRIQVAAAVALGSAGVGGLWWLRGAPWVALTGLALALGLVAAHTLGRPSSLPTRKMVFVVAAVALGVVVQGPSIASDVRDNYVSQRSGTGATTSYFTNRTFAEGAGVTPYLTPGKELGGRNLLLLWGRGLFVPSPLRVVVEPSAALVVELANALGWYALLFLAVRGAARNLRLPPVLLVVVTCVAISFATTALTTLGADATRHRVVILPLLCALAVRTPRSDPTATSPRLGRAALMCVAAGAAAYNLLWLHGALVGGAT